uniref:(California timema) hypothetical protein n=1 Tax=Timema californicum TaxID=61474 RepID=A0A7R9IW09_TIMCA|nr:unnamed protein product [Timema californicum]
MPSKKKKYNARFPATPWGPDTDSVSVFRSLWSLRNRCHSIRLLWSQNPYPKQCILSESRFDFLKDLVKALHDSSTFEAEDGAGVSSPLTVPSTKAEPPR